MAETYDERGEPIGTMPVEEMAPPQQSRVAPSGMRPDGADYIHPSLAGRNAVPGNLGGMVVPRAGVVPGPSAQEWRNTQEYLAQSAKAGQLDKAQKDVEQALRFLGMRGVEKDVEAGIPYHQALSKHLPYISWNNPQQAAIYSRIIEQAQPPAPLSMQNVGGVQVLRTPRGDRIVPQSAIPRPTVTSAQSIPFTDPATGQPVAGHFAVPSASGSGFTVHRKAGEVPEMTHSQRRLELNDAIKFKGAQIDRLVRPPVKEKEAHAEWKARVDKLNAEIDALEQSRQSPTKKEKGKEDSRGQSVPPRAARKIGEKYKLPGGPKGPAGFYRWTADGWEPA